MKIMVTGAGGFVGSRLTAYYGEKYDVWGVTHKDLDLTDEAAVFKTVENYRPDVLLHCAAVSDVAECSKKPELSHAVNVLGTEYLAKACGKTGTKLVMCSSDQVYFRKQGRAGESGRISGAPLGGLHRNAGATLRETKAAG
ncbi:MAG: sugar nucleotide-binding protein [Gallintestinimicrobium sp.]